MTFTASADAGGRYAYSESGEEKGYRAMCVGANRLTSGDCSFLPVAAPSSDTLSLRERATRRDGCDSFRKHRDAWVRVLLCVLNRAALRAALNKVPHLTSPILGEGQTAGDGIFAERYDALR
jgi:hypothetical protein